MQPRIPSLGAVVAALLLGTTAFGQGADECASATAIVGEGAFAFSTVGSTANGPAPTCGMGLSRDVWFEWTTAAASDYHLSICTTSFDVVVAVYDACGGVLLGCEDADGCTPSLFDIELDLLGLAPGTPYIVRITGWQGAQGTGVLEIAEIPPLANDDCAAATPIGGTGAFAFDTRTASTDGLIDPACLAFGSDQIESDVWFAWTAPATGLFTLATCESTPLDTRLAVYDAQSCPPIAALGCSDDACQFQSSLELMALLGQSYLVRVGSFSPSFAGEGSFTITAAAPPAGDDCLDAVPIAGAGPFAFDNRLATTDGPAHAGCAGFAGDQIDGDLWFLWTAPTTDDYQVSTCGGTTLDTKVAVYDGTSCPPAALASCGTNECGLQSQARFAASAAATYLVRVGSASPFHRAAGTFTVDLAPDPAGDDCADAVAIVGQGVFDFDNRGATTDGAPALACSSFSATDIHDDVWYRWTPAKTGRYSISTCGLTALDTKLAVYAGSACATGPPIGCDDDACGLQSRVVVDVLGGATYLVRLGAFTPGSEGVGQLAIERLGPGFVRSRGVLQLPE